MAGNVAELCQDGYRQSLGWSWVADPLEPRESPEVVLRGGSYQDLARALRASAREVSFGGLSLAHIGFRCARSLAGFPHVVDRYLFPEEVGQYAIYPGAEGKLVNRFAEILLGIKQVLQGIDLGLQVDLDKRIRLGAFIVLMEIFADSPADAASALVYMDKGRDPDGDPRNKARSHYLRHVLA